TLELGNVLALLVAGYMACAYLWRRRPLAPAAGAFHPLTVLGALAVPVVYTAANFADQYYRYGRFLAGPTHEGCLSLPAGLAGMVSAAGLWLQAGLLPSKIDLGVGSRMSVVAVHPTFSRALLFQGAVAATAVLAFVAVAARSVRQTGRLPVGLVALLFAAAYTAVLVFLRAGPRGLEAGLDGNSYYAYIFNLALLLFLATLLDRGAGAPPARLPRAALGLALAVLALVGACRVYAQGKAEARWGKPTRSLVAEIRRLRAAHGGEDGFTFAVAPDHPGEDELPFVGRDSDGRPLTVAQVLFPRHYSRARPRYLLCKPYRGFELLRYNGWVWGLSLGRDRRCLVSKTEAEVEQEIDRCRAALGCSSHHGRE
ncbi:MAG TPA: hypothetical protein VJ739_04905, partial [Gemmataceae bacterium]|nr:hypothetical protein [Gemmataceae bacterium]